MLSHFFLSLFYLCFLQVSIKGEWWSKNLLLAEENGLMFKACYLISFSPCFMCVFASVISHQFSKATDEVVNIALF